MNVELIGSKLKISAAGTAVVGGTEWYFFLFCFFLRRNRTEELIASINMPINIRGLTWRCTHSTMPLALSSDE